MSRPECDRWTLEELLAQARRLEVPDASEMSRNQLIDALLRRELSG
ncbi:MAG: Rho termination factor N-terminal domain-containing protein [Pseudomonadota bacterium]